MAQPNRETVRDQLATLLETTLVTNDEIVQAVYNYRISDFGGKSPVVVVSSKGSNREQTSAMPQPGVMDALFYLTIHVFVLYASGDWTEDNAEDRLDRIERGIADVIDGNRKVAGVWQAIDYEGDTERDSVVDGGDTYIRETIPIGVRGLYG